MERYLDLFTRSFTGYARYLWHDVTVPSPRSYVYLLVGLSLLVLLWEQLLPWRKEQPRIREGFWLDGFYMFFNFFLFSLAGFNAVSEVAATAFSDLRAALGVESMKVVDVGGSARWVQLGVFFVARDFIHYWIHRLLHRVPMLWRFHEVHHSVRQMGFAAHLRFHWAETVVYRALEFVPMGMLGFSVTDFFVVHATALLIGHVNHANVHLPLGPLQRILNGPALHVWHHVKRPPVARGVDFALSLSLWDTLFGTYYLPSSGRDLELGFDGVERYPKGFLSQMVAPFRKRAGSLPAPSA